MPTLKSSPQDELLRSPLYMPGVSEPSITSALASPRGWSGGLDARGARRGSVSTLEAGKRTAQERGRHRQVNKAVVPVAGFYAGCVGWLRRISKKCPDSEIPLTPSRV